MSYIPLPRRRPKPDFSLTIINIVFILLLFYLATGSLIKGNELAADIPLTSDLPLEKLPRPILLITKAGELFLDGSPVARADLIAGARKALEPLPQGTYLNVLAERGMPASAFLDIVAVAGEAGVPVRVVTFRDPQSHGAPP